MPIIALVLLLVLTSCAFAAEPAPACLEEQITVQQLKQQNAALTQQVLCGAQCQQQFDAAGKASQEAKAEQARLEALRSTPTGQTTQETP